MAFYKWWREAQLSQDVRMLERVVSYLHTVPCLPSIILYFSQNSVTDLISLYMI